MATPVPFAFTDECDKSLCVVGPLGFQVLWMEAQRSHCKTESRLGDRIITFIEFGTDTQYLRRNLPWLFLLPLWPNQR